MPREGRAAVNEPQVHIREHAVPGVGRAYEMPVEGGLVLSLVVDARTAERTLSVLRPGEDEPAVVVHLDESRALALSTLMAGMRVEVEPSAPREAVQVDTVVIGAGSPASGRTVAELDATGEGGLPDPGDARVIAVIRDDTPELLEDDPHRPCQPGDRLVLAGRPGPLAELRRWLVG
jgi:K+/H+ antiporter YhaU regulatory subunit KhtT